MSGPADIWRFTSIEEVEATARMATGLDEPFDDYDDADMATDHWTRIAEKLRQENVLIGAVELSRLPHDVALADRLRSRLITA